MSIIITGDSAAFPSASYTNTTESCGTVSGLSVFESNILNWTIQNPTVIGTIYWEALFFETSANIDIDNYISTNYTSQSNFNNSSANNGGQFDIADQIDSTEIEAGKCYEMVLVLFNPDEPDQDKQVTDIRVTQVCANVPPCCIPETTATINGEETDCVQVCPGQKTDLKVCVGSSILSTEDCETFTPEISVTENADGEICVGVSNTGNSVVCGGTDVDNLVEGQTKVLVNKPFTVDLVVERESFSNGANTLQFFFIGSVSGQLVYKSTSQFETCSTNPNFQTVSWGPESAPFVNQSGLTVFGTVSDCQYYRFRVVNQGCEHFIYFYGNLTDDTFDTQEIIFDNDCQKIILFNLKCSNGDEHEIKVSVSDINNYSVYQNGTEKVVVTNGQSSGVLDSLECCEELSSNCPCTPQFVSARLVGIAQDGSKPIDEAVILDNNGCLNFGYTPTLTEATELTWTVTLKCEKDGIDFFWNVQYCQKIIVNEFDVNGEFIKSISFINPETNLPISNLCGKETIQVVIQLKDNPNISNPIVNLGLDYFPFTANTFIPLAIGLIPDADGTIRHIVDSSDFEEELEYCVTATVTWEKSMDGDGDSTIIYSCSDVLSGWLKLNESDLNPVLNPNYGDVSVLFGNGVIPIGIPSPNVANTIILVGNDRIIFRVPKTQNQNGNACIAAFSETIETNVGFYTLSWDEFCYTQFGNNFAEQYVTCEYSETI